jgi:arylsulfatase A-like enzyme
LETNKDTTTPKPSRRDVLKIGSEAIAGIAALGLPPPGQPGQSQTPNPRPNVLIFMTDGQRPDEIGIAGNPLLKTPNMDRIITEGIAFRNAFVVNALCAPTRATFLTGLYSVRHGVIDNKDRPIAEGVPLISNLLRAAGYEVAFCGKSHVRDALRNYYWDYYFGYAGQADYFGCRIAEGVKGKIGKEYAYADYVDDVVTKAAIEWLEGRGQKPFCLFLWLYAAHSPFIRPRRYADLYNGVPIPKPATYDDDLKGYPGKPKAFANATNKIGTPYEAQTLEALVKDHYATIVAADDNLGRVIDVLTKLDRLDDTAIVITADHGFFLGEWHMFDKRFMHEPSIRIPLAIRYPQMIKPGTVSRKMTLDLDIAPTVLDFAGVKTPGSFQGCSLSPLFRGDESKWRKDWFYEYYENPGIFNVPKNRGIRTDRYKLIEYYEESPVEYELYDLERDPGETHNLHGDPGYADVTKQLLQRLDELRKETGEM